MNKPPGQDEKADLALKDLNKNVCEPLEGLVVRCDDNVLF